MFEDAIRRGVQALDQDVPNWRERVDVLTLDVRSIHACVLSQVFGSYASDLCAAFILRHAGWITSEGATQTFDERAAYLGFDVRFTELNAFPLIANDVALYDQLTHDWRVELLTGRSSM